VYITYWRTVPYFLCDVKIKGKLPGMYVQQYSLTQMMYELFLQLRYDAFKEFVDSDGMTQSQNFKPRELTVSPDKETVTVNELSPFTTYNVNVTAMPSDRSYRPPAKITVTTHMAAPQPMVKPDVCFHAGKVHLFLPQASEEYGPISHYYLIVVPDTKRFANKIPDQFHTDNVSRLCCMVCLYLARGNTE